MILQEKILLLNSHINVLDACMSYLSLNNFSSLNYCYLRFLYRYHLVYILEFYLLLNNNYTDSLIWNVSIPFSRTKPSQSPTETDHDRDHPNRSWAVTNYDNICYNIWTVWNRDETVKKTFQNEKITVSHLIDARLALPLPQRYIAVSVNAKENW